MGQNSNNRTRTQLAPNLAANRPVASAGDEPLSLEGGESEPERALKRTAARAAVGIVKVPQTNERPLSAVAHSFQDEAKTQTDSSRSPRPLDGRSQGAIPLHAKAAPEAGSDYKASYAFNSGAQQNHMSRIEGIDEPHNIERTMATQLNFVSFDKPTLGAGGLVKVIFFSLLAAAGLVLALFPDYRHQAFDAFDSAKDSFIGLVRHQPESERRRIATQTDEERSPDHVRLRLPPQPADGARRGAATLKDCSSLASTAGDTVISSNDRMLLADCFLLHDDPLNAEVMLRPMANNTKALAAPATGHSASADVFLTLMTALLKEGKMRQAAQLVGSSCLHWEPTTACVGKAMLVAERRGEGGGDQGLRLLFSNRAITGKAASYLLLAGAELARDSGNLRMADSRYGLALAAAPSNAAAVRKQIYESEALDLLQRDDLPRLRKLTGTALAELHNLEPNSLIKLKLLQDLAMGVNKLRALHIVLTREDATYRLRGDYDMVEALGLPAMRADLLVDYTHLLGQTREFYTTRYQSIDAVGKRLTLQEIRATLARNETDQALQMLNGYANNYGEDQYSHHLRGVAYASVVDSPRYQIQAAQEFQEALHIKRDWESLYALGITLIRAGKDSRVAPLIRDLTRLVSTQGQHYWLDMLTAEWYISQGNYPNAQKIINAWRETQPGRQTPLKLLLHLYQKTGKTTAVQTLEADLGRLDARQPFNTTAEGLASPLGVMALGRRPIE